MAILTLRSTTARQSRNWLLSRYTRPSCAFDLQHGYLQRKVCWQTNSFVYFSTSTSLTLPRSRYKPQQWPGFRNESPELRFVRDHNLFNPSDEPNTDVPRLADPLRKTKRRTTQPVQLTSTSDVERELLHRAVHLPPSGTTINLLEHIIFDRSTKPNAAHYEVLILSNASPEHGSADNLRQIWQEMEQQKISFNVNIYTALLRALVVHPDVDMLTRVLEACEKMWIELDLEMLHYVTAVYVRAAMPEIALDYLDRIEGLGDASSVAASKHAGKAELWLYVLFIHHLTVQRDWDGVLRICYRLNDDVSLRIPFAMRQVDIPHDFWSWMLQQAVESGERWVSLWIWETWVARAWLRPNPSLCLQLLRICAEHGLVRWAHGVAAVLENLGPTTEIQGQGIDSLERISMAAEVRKLLDLAVKQAGPGESTLTPREEKFAAPYWTMFKKRHAFENAFETSFRFDSWSKLSEKSDAGRAWQRVLREREDAEDRRLQHEAEVEGRRVEKQRKQAIQTALSSLPAELLHDIDTAANAEPDFGEQVKLNTTLHGDIETQDIIDEVDSQSPELYEVASFEFWPHDLPNPLKPNDTIDQSPRTRQDESESKAMQPSTSSTSCTQRAEKPYFASDDIHPKELSEPIVTTQEVSGMSIESAENEVESETSSKKGNPVGRGRKRGRRSIEALERRAYRIALNRAGLQGSSDDYKKDPDYKSFYTRPKR